jgi:uncharacterized phage-associated protein
MRSENLRTPEEILTDKALLLALYSLVAKKNKINDMLKAQKLPFLVAAPLFWKSQKAFSLEFYRYQQGPMSNGIYNAIDDFNQLQLMYRNEYLVSQPTKRAIEFSNDFINEVLSISDNEFCYKEINKIVEYYGKYSGEQLRDLVYKLPFKTIESDKEQLVRDVPRLQHFTNALDEDEAIEKINISKSWMDTLAILLNPSNYESLLRAELSDCVNS